jgi:hypothetical protein
MSVINIDSTGWVCNNEWAFQGAWYCYADTLVTNNSCVTGVPPFSATSGGMCISGTTSTSTNATTAFGAGIGLNFDQPEHGANAVAFNMTTAKPAPIVGFAITISGSSGGSVFNISFPQLPQLTTSGEAAAVTVPGISGTTVTYNVMIADAIVSDNATAPVPKITATDVSAVQVTIPGADGVAHAYDYCVTNIVPLTAEATAPAALTAYGASFNEGKQIVLEGLGPYGIQNDPFNVGGDPMAMTVSYGGGEAGFSATPSFGPTGSTPGAFPSIVDGWIHGGNVVSASEGGYAGSTAIGVLTAVTSNWTFTPGTGNWDAAYDCWLAGNPAPINPGFELMVWLDHSVVNPIGGQNTPVTVTGATGSWTLSTGTNGTGQPVVSYVSTTAMTSVTGFNLLPFYKDAATNNRYPAGSGFSTSTILLGVQAGFELYNPGTWTTNSYSISIH